MNSAHKLPLMLGIHGTYKGYHYLVATLEMALERQESLVLFTKSIFPAVARKYGTNVGCVERNIRTVIKLCWNSPCRETLQAISPYHLFKKPTVGEFIDILYWYLKNLEQ